MNELVQKIIKYLGPKFVGAAVISIPVLVTAAIVTLGIAVYRDQPMTFLSLPIGPTAPRLSNPEQGLPPIGAILPYYGNVSDLQPNWKVCDGSVLNDRRSTTFHGRAVPNLSDDRFLMGVSGATATELAARQGGRNDIPDGSHTHTGTATQAVTHYPWGNGTQFQRDGGQAFNHTHAVDIPQSGAHNHGGENRPKYQGVFFVIRVW